MAKIAFSKLGLKINESDCSYTRDTLDGTVEIEVKLYLPIKEKMELVSRIVNQSIDDNGFYNPMRVKLYTALEVMYAYTNISFTEKQKEDPFKLYDLIISTGLFCEVVEKIRDKDWLEIQENVWDTIKGIYEYRNSVMGILDNVRAEYSDLNLEVNEISEKLSDPNDLGFLKDVITKLG